MPQKVSPASAFLPVVSCFSPASALRHQGSSGIAGHGLVRHCPAMLVCNRGMREKKNISISSVHKITFFRHLVFPAEYVQIIAFVYSSTFASVATQ
jgi:hypothetical protein